MLKFVPQAEIPIFFKAHCRKNKDGKVMFSLHFFNKMTLNIDSVRYKKILYTLTFLSCTPLKEAEKKHVSDILMAQSIIIFAFYLKYFI